MKKIFLLLITVCLVVMIFFAPPIPQDPAYHSFADKRALLGIPNCWNVLSNLPFLLFGLYGFLQLQSLPKKPLRPYRFAASCFFIGLVLTGIGSGYYHFHPNNHSLLWDRLPMTIAFMAFFSCLLGLHFNPKLTKQTLLPLLILGAVSVLYWYTSEMKGKGDLRLYIVVQFIPILLMPIMLYLFKTTAYNTHYILITIGVYIIAKLLEHYDALIYLSGISGHSLKHIAASLSGLTFLGAIKSIREGKDAL